MALGTINGTFIYNGQPQNGATAKLWKITGFASYADSTDTVQDNPLADTSIELNVTNGGLFAAADVIRIEIEYLKIWAISANKLYVIRGWHGSAPAAHVQTTPIYDETITPPQQDDAEPGGGYQQGGSVTTGVTYGGDGEYRFDAVPEGEYYASVEYDTHRAFFYAVAERDDPTLQQILTVDEDIIVRRNSGPIRVAKGAAESLLCMTAANLVAWLAPGANKTVLFLNAAGQLTWTAEFSTKEFFVPVSIQGPGFALTDKGEFPVADLAALNDEAFMSFKVPSDFTTLTTAEIIVIPQVTDGAANWDINSDYGADGEAYNLHSETDAASTYNVVINQLFAVDISGILSALAADDYVGITLKLADALDDVFVVGLWIKYAI